MDRPTAVPFFRAAITALLDAFVGDVAEAHRRSSDSREEALLARDRFTFVGAAYSDAVASLTSGCLPHLEAAIQSSFSTGRAAMLLRPFFDAILNIGAIKSALAGRSADLTRALLEDADGYVPRPGPLFGMGSDVPMIIANAAKDPIVFDRDMANAIRRRRELGYLLAATSVTVLAGAARCGPAIADEARLLTELVDIPLYSRPLRAIIALAERDIEELSALISTPANGDQTVLAQIVISASRQARRSGDVDLEDALEPIASALSEVSDGNFEPLYIYGDETSGPALTDREREIAQLAAFMKNTDIAARLNISVRTVENHIANSLRKTGTRNRDQLSAYVAR